MAGRLPWPEALRTGAEAEAAAGAWRFTQRGFWRRNVEVEEATTGSAVGTLGRSGFRGEGTIALGGETLALLVLPGCYFVIANDHARAAAAAGSGA